MKHLFSILLAAILCATASAQSIRTLGYNSTNGQVVANTGTNVLTFTNDVQFGGGDLLVSGQVISGSGVSFSFENADFAYGATLVRESLGFSTNLNTLWTATNASNARSAVGLGATNGVTFFNVNASGFVSAPYIEANEFFLVEGGIVNFEGAGGTINFEGAINFGSSAAGVRSNLGLGLPALTNTSNVTMMRALAGSTNTNEPFSGSISVVGTNNTNTLVFSNGILLSQ